MHVAVSYDFLPKIGGAHLWLYEVYRRWPSPVAILTECAVDPGEAAAQRAFDAQGHGSLQVHRRAIRRHINVLDPRSAVDFLRQAGRLRTLLGGNGGCLHALRAFPEGFAAALCKRVLARSTRLVTYAHGEEILIAQTSAQLRSMAKLSYAGSDLVIANSESTKRLVIDMCPTAKVVCINPGVDAQSFVVSPQRIHAYRNRWGWPPDTTIVCTVARMEPRKNQQAVIDALAQLRAQGLRVAYVCAGKGEERQNLMERASRSGLAEWVRFPDSVDETEKRLIFASADIHAMPSIQVGAMIEGFGIVFLEAAAAGIPSICGNIGGQPEAVNDGVTGLVVDGSRVEDVAGAIRKLVEQPELRRQMGSSGKQWALQNDWQQVAERTVGLVSAL